MSYIEKGDPAFLKASIALFFGGFVTFSNLYTPQPLLPVFAEEFRANPSVTSLALSLSTGTLAVAMLFSAGLADRFGKKRIMEFSMILTSVIAILIPFSPDFTMLLVLRTVLGIAAAGVPSLAMAYVAEEFHPSSVGQVMGLYISGTSIGGLAGRIMTGIFTDLWSWKTALVIIGVIALILSVIFVLILPAPQHSIRRPVNLKTLTGAYRRHIANKPLAALIALGFLFMGGFVTLFNYIGFLLSGPPFFFSQTLIGLIFLVYLFGSFSSVYMGKKADIKGHAPVLKFCVLLTISGALLTLSSSVAAIMLGVSLFAFGFFASHSIASSWIGETATVNKAQASSLYLLCYYTGSSIAGTLGGLFWIQFRWTGVVLFVCSLLFARDRKSVV